MIMFLESWALEFFTREETLRQLILKVREVVTQEVPSEALVEIPSAELPRASWAEKLLVEAMHGPR